MRDLIPLDQLQDATAEEVGGKGLSLGRMLTAGLRVPPGFVITCSASRRYQNQPADPLFVQQLQAAYRQLGSGPVAVRSSATAEDGDETSFAGQQATLLGVVGLEALLQAVQTCWQSLHTERAKAYRRQQGLDDANLAMAVVVQQLVPADVAGVLFTHDPDDPSQQRLSIESAWGLGEVVVSGRVTPDRFRVNFTTGEILDQRPGRKPIRVTAHGEEPVPAELVDAVSLTPEQLCQLAELARQVEAFYQAPRDVEWAIAAGQVYLLQARPITTPTAAEREQIRQEILTQLRSQADPRGTVWVQYNLSEVLHEPTPLTWSVLQRLLAANGGFGAMNRDLGGLPDFRLGDLGAFDLIAGRPMCNLSRLPRLQFSHPPIEYPLAKFRADPRQALNPKPVLKPLRGGLLGLLRLPANLWRIAQMNTITRGQLDRFPEQFTRTILPEFKLACRTAQADDWSRKTPEELLQLADEWIERTLVKFARDSLKPTVLADLCWVNLQETLKLRLGEAGAAQAVAEVARGARPPEEADVAAALRKLAELKLSPAAFQEQFGHRGRNEMELSQPRWSEEPDLLPEPRLSRPHDEIPFAEVWSRIVQRGKLGPYTQANGLRFAEKLRLFLGLREAAKHYLLLGYALIRRAYVLLSQRTDLGADIFYLTRDELPRLLKGDSFREVIRQRKRRRRIERGLTVPPVLFSDDLDALGRPLPGPEGQTSWTGVGLSVGVAEGPALVLREPTTHLPSEPFILVCPSTDPDWVPLFSQASGLVMETGGVLSHGAIVAREFGLPAVAGFPGLLDQLTTGECLRLDGTTGTLTRLS